MKLKITNVAHIFLMSPFSKPRQTRRDKYDPSDAVVKYRFMADKLRLLARQAKYEPKDTLSITFLFKMPESWSKKKQGEMLWTPHQVRPDLDNLIKGFKDALFNKYSRSKIDDSTVWKYGEMKKLWSDRDAIIIHKG